MKLTVWGDAVHDEEQQEDVNLTFCGQESVGSLLPHARPRIMLGRVCLTTLLGKQFPPPLNWAKCGFQSG